ncbi:hypothetical protein BOX15_Mlig002616g1 [Macrostomum lignano]|uniref:Uncharacterized protein n=1 Tax=Macrostomum lignano TaxID=282301 RepID=A0A267G0T0_9PLAT|nr:hypothetical protein BOX15_Mlig002616g1 [Macrostomum lignano]
MGSENKHKNAALNVFGRFLQIVQLFNTADQEAAYPLLPQQPFNENLRTELERMLQQNLRANEDTAKRISNQVFDSIEEFWALISRMNHCLMLLFDTPRAEPVENYSWVISKPGIVFEFATWRKHTALTRLR